MSDQTPVKTERVWPPPPQINWTYRAQLVGITDGDTVKLLIDNGFYNREAHAIRLRGVNTPEIFTKNEEEKQKGMVAKDIVAKWFLDTEFCSELEGEDWPLILVTQKDKQTFNRYIGDIYCICGDWLNEYLREEGY